ncbi:MAG: NAD(P)H-hydrate epimerase, partial [Saprospiraceae bacterium]|nr:NAD(P)H-hydrate epimerase [Saprospiraceae bacterium]
MLPIYTASQIKEIEQLTCKEQEITSLQLMERAGQVFSLWFSQQFKNKSKALHIFCGNGNNGGDGLVIARLLNISGYTINVYLIPIGPTSTPDNATNLEKLNDYPSITLYPLSIDNYFLPEINQDDIIIDAILGTGANRPIDENWKKLFDWINSRSNIKISVDLPSGLPTDSVFSGTVIHSDYVLGFEFPKLSYLLPEHSNYIKNWIVESIQLTKNVPKT